MAHVVSLSDLRDKEQQDGGGLDRQTYYAGGAKSGVAIVGPDRSERSTPSDSLFEDARRAGEQAAVEKREGETVLHVTAVFYADRMEYRVEEQESVLLAYESDEAKDFQEALRGGKLPAVLRAVRAKDGSVPLFDFTLIDKRAERYEAPKAKQEAPAPSFTGAAHTTGGSSEGALAHGACGLEPVVVDASAPTTSVQVRLPNGRRVVGKFNVAHTVRDLRRFIDTHAQAAPVVAGHSYELVAALPPRPLTDLSETLQAAKLCNASVNVRLC